jgi:hypothetical protein
VAGVPAGQSNARSMPLWHLRHDAARTPPGLKVAPLHAAAAWLSLLLSLRKNPGMVTADKSSTHVSMKVCMLSMPIQGASDSLLSHRKNPGMVTAGNTQLKRTSICMR